MLIDMWPPHIEKNESKVNNLQVTYLVNRIILTENLNKT